MEEHLVDGRPKQVLVHRKGSTRAFPPHHPLIPVDYQFTGQPVLIGGTMGTCSYVLTGTEKVWTPCRVEAGICVALCLLAHRPRSRPVCAILLSFFAAVQGMMETFGSTCHGAGRASSRAKSR